MWARVAAHRHLARRMHAARSTNTQTMAIRGREYAVDPAVCNVSPAMAARLERGSLLHARDSPVAQAAARIAAILDMPLHADAALYPPVVSTADNFDALGFPAEHPSRSPRDTYFLTAASVLRTHMTAQERVALGAGERRFLLAGDVFRRDCIDTTHYPVFHQLEGVSFVPRPADMRGADAVLARICAQDARLAAIAGEPPETRAVVADLVETLERLVRRLFASSPCVETRWLPDAFPYTHPSLQLEVRPAGGAWAEVLGCGVLRPPTYADVAPACPGDAGAWAFGLGLERVAMALHGIPDIRLFWCGDARFSAQFKSDVSSPPVRYVPFSVHPPVHRDISLAVGSPDFGPLPELTEAVRAAGGDLVERLALRDVWRIPGGAGWSHTFRVTYRAMGRSLTDAEANAMQAAVRASASRLPGVTLR